MSNGSMHPNPEALYYFIASDALKATKEIAKAKQDDSTEFKRKEAVTTSLVFSALCLEAFIN